MVSPRRCVVVGAAAKARIAGAAGVGEGALAGVGVAAGAGGAVAVGCGVAGVCVGGAVGTTLASSAGGVGGSVAVGASVDGALLPAQAASRNSRHTISSNKKVSGEMRPVVGLGRQAFIGVLALTLFRMLAEDGILFPDHTRA